MSRNNCSCLAVCFSSSLILFRKSEIVLPRAATTSLSFATISVVAVTGNKTTPANTKKIIASARVWARACRRTIRTMLALHVGQSSRVVGGRQLACAVCDHWEQSNAQLHGRRRAAQRFKCRHRQRAQRRRSVNIDGNDRRLQDDIDRSSAHFFCKKNVTHVDRFFFRTQRKTELKWAKMSK